MAEKATNLRRVPIEMPAWMLDELRDRALLQGITLTELIRRGVSVDKLIRDQVADGKVVTFWQGPDDPEPTVKVTERQKG